MTKLQAIRQFCHIICGEPIVIAMRRDEENNWKMDLNTENKSPRLIIPSNIYAPSTKEDKQFRQNFIERCPLARGFSNITLTLLHECGHWMTRSVWDSFEYDKWDKKTTDQIEYMKIPWELLATDWAICWLNCPANRQLAKDFERDYFGY